MMGHPHSSGSSPGSSNPPASQSLGGRQGAPSGLSLSSIGPNMPAPGSIHIPYRRLSFEYSPRPSGYRVFMSPQSVGGRESASSSPSPGRNMRGRRNIYDTDKCPYHRPAWANGPKPSSLPIPTFLSKKGTHQKAPPGPPSPSTAPNNPVLGSVVIRIRNQQTRVRAIQQQTRDVEFRAVRSRAGASADDSIQLELDAEEFRQLLRGAESRLRELQVELHLLQQAQADSSSSSTAPNSPVDKALQSPFRRPDYPDYEDFPGPSGPRIPKSPDEGRRQEGPLGSSLPSTAPNKPGSQKIRYGPPQFPKEGAHQPAPSASSLPSTAPNKPLPRSQKIRDERREPPKKGTCQSAPSGPSAAYQAPSNEIGMIFDRDHGPRWGFLSNPFFAKDYVKYQAEEKYRREESRAIQLEKQQREERIQDLEQQNQDEETRYHQLQLQTSIQRLRLRQAQAAPSSSSMAPNMGGPIPGPSLPHQPVQERRPDPAYVKEVENYKENIQLPPPLARQDEDEDEQDEYDQEQEDNSPSPESRNYVGWHHDYEGHFPKLSNLPMPSKILKKAAGQPAPSDPSPPIPNPNERVMIWYRDQDPKYGRRKDFGGEYEIYEANELYRHQTWKVTTIKGILDHMENVLHTKGPTEGRVSTVNRAREMVQIAEAEAHELLLQLERLEQAQTDSSSSSTSSNMDSNSSFTASNMERSPYQAYDEEVEDYEKPEPVQAPPPAHEEEGDAAWAGRPRNVYQTASSSSPTASNIECRLYQAYVEEVEDY